MLASLDSRRRWAIAVALIAMIILGFRAFDHGPSATASPPGPLAAGGAGSAGPVTTDGGGPTSTSTSTETTAAVPGLTVDVDGAVRTPGVYVLAAGSRVQDALVRAGGTLHGADLAAVNRAAPLVDGEQVLVPSVAPLAGSGAAASSDPGAGASAGPVSLNSASAAQLDALPGIGPATAAKIVADRAAHGPFHSVADLQRVPGIGPAKMTALTALLTL